MVSEQPCLLRNIFQHLPQKKKNARGRPFTYTIIIRSVEKKLIKFLSMFPGYMKDS